MWETQCHKTYHLGPWEWLTQDADFGDGLLLGLPHSPERRPHYEDDSPYEPSFFSDVAMWGRQKNISKYVGCHMCNERERYIYIFKYIYIWVGWTKGWNMGTNPCDIDGRLGETWGTKTWKNNGMFTSFRITTMQKKTWENRRRNMPKLRFWT